MPDASIVAIISAIIGGLASITVRFAWDKLNKPEEDKKDFHQELKAIHQEMKSDRKETQEAHAEILRRLAAGSQWMKDRGDVITDHEHRIRILEHR